MCFIHAVIYFTISFIKIIIHLCCHLFSLHSSPFYLLVFFHLIILYLCMVFLFSTENKEWKILIYFLVRFDFILLCFVAYKDKRDDFEHFICQATKKLNLSMFLSFVLLRYLFPYILTKICCNYFEWKINIYQLRYSLFSSTCASINLWVFKI